MKWIKFWKRKSKNEHPFRRIYRGDVPLIGDTDAGLPQPHHGLSATKGSIRGSLRNQQTNQNNETEEPIPRSVRRQSISPGASKTKLGKKIAPEKFPDNLVVTSRYTLWNFVPKNLFEQFRRVVNFYFLVVALVQTVIDSPVHPVTAVTPLAFVILVTAVKQGYEDWLRHKSDEQVNNRIVRRIRDGKLEEVKSKDIHVGDIVKLEGDEQVPTDVLVLGSSDEFLRCQINTANLDGETNLKLRYCPSGLPNFSKEEYFENLHMIVECEHPNEDLYEFNGSLLIPSDKLNKLHWASHSEVEVSHTTNSLRSAANGEVSTVEQNDQNLRPLESEQIFPSLGEQKKPVVKHENKSEILNDLMKGLVRQGMTDFLSIPLSMDNMTLRGTRLKNTDFVYGMVIYTGKDTRLARNSEKSQSKFSTVESAVNFYLAFFIGMLGILVSFSCTMYYAYDWNNGLDTPWYKDDRREPEHKDAKRILNTVASFIILFNYIIPISLYVTIELQKFLGSKFFVWDNDMVDDEGKEPLCNTSDLNEELGLIEYLFSDKTGTLTQNVMKFTHCSIQKERYELKHEDQKLYQLAHGSQEEKQVNIFSSQEVLYFFKTLALCHSVQVVPRRRPSFEMDPKIMSKMLNDLKLKKNKRKSEKKEKSEMQNRRESLITPQPSSEANLALLDGMEYQASSPDEKALLETCESLGIVYVGEKEDWMTISVNGVTEKYKRLMILEFDADRKCMSVIVENSKKEIWLLTKGAESSIIPRCVEGPTQETLKHVMEYALMGLRTLAVAVRKLSQHELDEFNVQLRAARRLLKNRQEKVREVYTSIENQMTLLGATGVEDQLQDHVPETLQSFAAAGIRVWMLTGDKLETGVNVAISCGLITASTKRYVVSQVSDPVQIKTRLLEIQGEMDKSDNTCFVIDGESLGWAFKECPDILREVSMAAFKVVCCRMAPLQKAQVVNMVKNSKEKPTCCAVGDGANDCAMILAAHIGIGILGKEGRQAARCADFALAKFGHLRKAILVHGHWYYVRLANLANYFFYKNVVFVLPQFFFSFNSQFSTLALFNGLFLMNYNIFFSSCPIFFYGLTEQPYAADVLLKYPQLYKKNARNSLMTVKQFFPWFVSSIWHALTCYYLPYFSWNNFDHMNDVQTFGTVVFSGIVLTTNMKMFVETKFVSWWYVASHLYSYGTFFLMTIAISEIPADFFNADDFRHVFIKMLSSLCFWLLVVLVGTVSVLPDVTFAVLKRSWKKIVRHFNTFGQAFLESKWLKLRRKRMDSFPKTNLLFTKRTGSLVISNSTLTSYLPNNA